MWTSTLYMSVSCGGLFATQICVCVLVTCTVFAPICENKYSGSTLSLEPNISSLVLCRFNCNLVLR